MRTLSALAVVLLSSSCNCGGSICSPHVGDCATRSCSRSQSTCPGGGTCVIDEYCCPPGAPCAAPRDGFCLR